MSGKRPHKPDNGLPSKKRHVKSNNNVPQENHDISNISLSASMMSMPAAESTRIKGFTMNSTVPDADLSRKSGKIKKIRLINFMCHSNFEVHLNSNVNVFVGLNGSGKSAILTALAIGLGSKASSTSRSTSLKDLVKQGEMSATIEITLTNDGFDTYEDDVYGNEITIVRTINANTGATNYKLKTSTGRVVSTLRKDLSKLTLCLNIQVENPVLLLNQDNARSFLRECDPKKLYTLFAKATQIEEIIDKLQACLLKASSSKAHLEHLVRSIAQNQQEVAVIREKHEKLQSVARLRRDIVVLMNELEWLEIIKEESLLKDAQAGVDKIASSINEILDFIKNKSKNDKQLKEKIRDFGTEFQRLQGVVLLKDDVADKCRSEFEKQKDEVSEIENSHRSLIVRKTEREKDIAVLEKDIEERENNPQNVNKIRQENEQKIEALEKKIEELLPCISTAQRDHAQFSETLSHSREQIEVANTHYKKIQSTHQGCAQQIRQLRGSHSDPLSAYGQSMSNFVKRIEEMHKRGMFAEMPRGPLGRYIEVPDKKFKSAVENVLKGILQSFYVSCDKDRILICQEMKRFPELSRMPIITGAFQKQVYDVRNGMVRLDHNDADGSVLMDIIKVSDPVVMNCLIDQNRIESIVFVDSTEMAIKLTQDAHNVPQNLSRVVLLKPLSEYFPAPNYRSYAMREIPPRFIQTNNQEVIAVIEQQKTALEVKMKQISDQIKAHQEDSKEKAQLSKQKMILISDLQAKSNNYKKEMNELKSIEYPAEDEIEFLRSELEKLITAQEKIRQKFDKAEATLKEKRESCAEKDAALKKSREQAREARDKMMKIQTDIENAQQQLRDMTEDIKLKQNQIADLKVQQAEYTAKVLELTNNVTALTQQTTSGRITTQRTEDQIQKIINSTKKRIQNIESHNDNIDDIELLLQNKMQQADKMIQCRTTLAEVLATLEQMRTSRFHHIKRLRQHMSLRCKHKFNVLMGLRNYTAEVEIDHKARTLELKVIPRDAAVTGAVSSTKALSGGERSYSTVAFLISLWSCVDHPFYFLDEYDVFSDEHNRHMMTKLLFDEAGKKLNKQYGFLTPQDFSNIEASDRITIHKLQDPDRMN